MTWSATQYTRFEAERTRPVRDLLAQVPEGPVRRAVDLGCGPGNSTELLLGRYPEALVLGLDSSPDMIAAARKRLPDLAFEVGNIAGWPGRGGPFDVVLANASLQWVPDHERLLPALMGRVAPGGHLAVQVPDNLDEPAHRLMRELAAAGPWSARLAGASSARASRHDAAWYYRALRQEARTVDIWRTTYHHVLPGGPAAIVEWFKGTGLRPFLQPLDPEEQAEFLARYEAGIAATHPTLPDGSVILPFPRLFFVATR